MQLRVNRWKVIGMAVYYVMFLSMGVNAGFAAFLLGFVFGSFFASPRIQANTITDLALQTEIYFVLGFPLFVIVGSGIYFAAPSGVTMLPISTKVLLSIVGVSLLYVSYIFSVQLFRNRRYARRVRLCITFGPIICGGLVGVAGSLLALGSFGIMSDHSWWISLVILSVSLLPAILALVLLVLFVREKPEAAPPSPRQMAT